MDRCGFTPGNFTYRILFMGRRMRNAISRRIKIITRGKTRLSYVSPVLSETICVP
jgi:hypothetical protein